MNGDKFYKAIVTILAVVVVGAVLFEIVLAPTSIGSPTSESDALVRASERLIEMVKWTISTIFIVGGALIGLNWYSNEHRYDRDRSEQEKRISDLRSAFNSVLENNAKQHLDLVAQLHSTRLEVLDLQSQVMQGLLFPNGEFPEGGYAQRVFELVEGHHVTPALKKRLLDHFLSPFENAVSSRSFLVFLGLDYLPELARSAEKQGLMEEASRAHAAYERLAKNRMEDTHDPDQSE